MKSMLTFNALSAVAILCARPGDGAIGPGGDAATDLSKMTHEKAVEALASLGITLKAGSRPQFSVKVSDPKVMDKGADKGKTFQRLADCVLTLKSGLPYVGCGVAALRSPKGHTEIVFMWPTTGSGPFTRGVVDTRGNGTRETPQYPKEAKIVEAVGRFFADECREWLIKEKAEGRGIQPKSEKTREGSVQVSADDTAAMGL